MRRLTQDQCGAIGIIGVVIIGIIALFGFSAAAAINWHFIIAAIVFTAVPIVAFAVAFKKLEPKFLFYTIAGCLAIVFLIEINIYNMVGLILIGSAMYYLKTLIPKYLSLFVILVGIGGLFMVLGYTYVLLPLGITP